MLLDFITSRYCCLLYDYSSVSGQDEPNLALWLATQAGKMELSCPLVASQADIFRGSSRKWLRDESVRTSARSGYGLYPGSKIYLSCFGSYIINPLLTKLVRSRWLDFDLVLFLRVYGNTQKKNVANIQPSWTSWLHAWSIIHISFLVVTY